MLKIESEVAIICFVIFRQIMLEKKEKKNQVAIFWFLPNFFYSNKQRGESKELENLARRSKYILFIKEIRLNF